MLMLKTPSFHEKNPALKRSTLFHPGRILIASGKFREVTLILFPTFVKYFSSISRLVQSLNWFSNWSIWDWSAIGLSSLEVNRLKVSENPPYFTLLNVLKFFSFCNQLIIPLCMPVNHIADDWIPKLLPTQTNYYRYLQTTTRNAVIAITDQTHSDE